MVGTVCLQGGGEFSPGCRSMDAELVRRAPGRVAVAALASPLGAAATHTAQGGVAHFRAVGAAEAVVAPDLRDDPERALDVLGRARLVVLPGGSPARLLDALSGTAAPALLQRLVDLGGAVMGASAGAMVLCEWTVVPDRVGARSLSVEPGLGIVPGLVVVPHWSGGSSRGDWLRAVQGAVPDGMQVVGIPEESGVLVDRGAGGTVLTAVGAAPSYAVQAGREIALGESWRLP